MEECQLWEIHLGDHRLREERKVANPVGRRTYKAPPEAEGRVKEIIELRNMGSGAFYLAPYSENELYSARALLREHDLRPALRSAIETELIRRNESGVVKDTKKKSKRFEDFELMWNAVRSLFDKGPWKRGHPDTIRYLLLIKDEWGRRYE